jgi:hypothetical protein
MCRAANLKSRNMRMMRMVFLNWRKFDTENGMLYGATLKNGR